MSEDRCKLALLFWEFSLQYLALVENIARETRTQGNVWVMVRNFKEGRIDLGDYFERTRWSDHRIIIPLLFNLFHGIELLVKGFLVIHSGENIRKQHNITDLCRRVKHKYPQENWLCAFVDKYTDENHMPELLRNFLKDNQLTVDDLYQALRYPSPDFVKMRRYSSLKYKGKRGISFFQELHQDTERVQREAVRLGRLLLGTSKDNLKRPPTD